MSNVLPPERQTPDKHQLLDQEVELSCGACNKRARYLVGRLYLDPEIVQAGEAEAMNRAFGFTNYFHCRHCGAGGPWDLTVGSVLLITALMLEAVTYPDRPPRINLARMEMFDGTVSRWPTQTEARLKELLAQTPEDYYLWSRLGNIYMHGEVFDLAVSAFQEALKRNEHDVESWHSLGEIYLDRNEPEEAARNFHQALRHARHAPPRTRPDFLRELVRHTLGRLFDLHIESKKQVPLFPTPSPEEIAAMSSGSPDSPRVVQLTSFDLSDDRDWDRMVDLWVRDRAPAPTPRVVRPSAPPARPSLPPPKPRRGRNSPCMCGSGKKYKQCCGRR